MSISIVCACDQLIDVLDKKVADHTDKDGYVCRASGMRYISRKISGRPSGPSVEVLAVKEEGPCDNCGGSHGGMALLRVSSPDPSNN